MTAAGPSILIIDPALTRRAGHHFNAARRLQHAARALGGRAETLCGRAAEADLVRELAAKPTFRTNFYSRVTFRRDKFERMARRTYVDLVATLPASGFAPDLIALPTCDQAQALALARFLRFARPPRMPAVAAWIVLPPGLMARDAVAAEAATAAQVPEIREGFAALAEAVGGEARLALYCETAAMADYYAGATGLDVGIMACPTTADLRRAAVAAPEGAGLTFVSLGHMNRGKGYDLLPAAIGRAVASGVDASFVIHGAGAGSHPAGRRLIGMLDALPARVETRTEDLSEEAYTALIESAGVVMLPYNPAVYGERGSGVFNEAEALGIPTLVTKGCSFAREAVESGRSVAAAEYSGEALAQAIVEASRSIEALRQRCRTFLAPDGGAGPADGIERTLERLLAGRAQNPGPCAHGPRPAPLSVIRGVVDGARHLGAKAERRFAELISPPAWRRRKEAWRAFAARAKGSGAGSKKGARIADLYGDAAWDVVAPGPPATRYIIAALHRSGSNLMARQLFRAGVGLPAEYFHPKLAQPLLERWGFATPDDPAYVARLMDERQTAGGVWGAKLHWEHVTPLSEPVRERLFEGARLIFTRRRDLAMQTLSYARALRTGRWDPRWSADPERREGLAEDDLDALAAVAGRLVDDECRWQEIAQRHGLEVQEVCYEDYLVDPERAHRRIFDFLGAVGDLPPREAAPPGKTGERTSDRVLAERLSEKLATIALRRPAFLPTTPAPHE